MISPAALYCTAAVPERGYALTEPTRCVSHTPKGVLQLVQTAHQRCVRSTLCFMSYGLCPALDFSRISRSGRDRRETGCLERILARIAALLRKMEQSRLIVRHASSEDKRRTVVEITPAGAAIVDEMRSQALARMGRLLSEIGEEDIETYMRISRWLFRAKRATCSESGSRPIPMQRATCSEPESQWLSGSE